MVAESETEVTSGDDGVAGQAQEGGDPIVTTKKAVGGQTEVTCLYPRTVGWGEGPLGSIGDPNKCYGYYKNVAMLL